MASRTVVLIGDPGSGKSKMACTTAVRKPVYCMDIDEKIRSHAWADAPIANGELLVWEIDEPVDPSLLTTRIRTLVTEFTKTGPPVRPRGWVKFAEQFYSLKDVHKTTPFGTVVVDSGTTLNEHLKAMISFDAKRMKFTFDNWNELKMAWMGTFSTMRDICKKNDWDLIFIVHERIKGEPGERTHGVKTEVIPTTEGLATQQIFQGTQDLKVWASIDGAFGDLLGSQAAEYYHLYVDTKDKEKPVWKCRVKPDGMRALRTGFDLKESVYDPDFRKIWK